MNPPRDLSPDRVSALLKTERLGKADLQMVEIAESTNLLLLAQAERGAAHGTVLVADHQTAGRGRQHRHWHNQPGKDLLFSVLLRPTLELSRLPSLVLAMGVAAHAVISELTPPPVRIKWPNDILIGGKKLCGILCQTTIHEAPAVVVGIGLNTNTQPADFPNELHGLATSLLATTGRQYDRGALLADLLWHLEIWFSRWEKNPAEVMQAWEERAAIRGQKVQVTDGVSSYQAIAQGLDDGGRLLVTVQGRQRVVACGDVFFAEE